MLATWQLLSLPSVVDTRGTLIPVDPLTTLGVPIGRCFVLDIYPGHSRGDHACKEGTQLIIPIRGNVKVSLHDGSLWTHLELHPPTSALKIGPLIWRSVSAATEGGLVLVVDSSPFNETNFIREFSDFQAMFSN
jgi:hypothetical protein